jgi:hypothetical protein
MKRLNRYRSQPETSGSPALGDRPHAADVLSAGASVYGDEHNLVIDLEKAFGE